MVILSIKPGAGYEFVHHYRHSERRACELSFVPRLMVEEFALASYYVTEGDVYYFETQVMKIKQATLKVDD